MLREVACLVGRQASGGGMWYYTELARANGVQTLGEMWFSTELAPPNGVLVWAGDSVRTEGVWSIFNNFHKPRDCRDPQPRTQPGAGLAMTGCCGCAVGNWAGVR
jgi:hypothetical protein